MKAATRNAHQSNATVISIHLGPHLKGSWPSEVIQAAREALFRRVKSNQLRGAWLQPFGEDLHVHIASRNADFAGGQGDRAVERASEVGLETSLKALEKALELGIASPESRRLLTLSLPEQIDALGVWFLNLPYTERGAEPIVVAKAIHASWGFFNRALFNLFFNPDKGSGRRIEANDYLAIVESIEDLASNAPSIRTYEFGPGK